jgi:hypothetical protein
VVGRTILDKIPAECQRIGFVEPENIISEDAVDLPHADIGAVPTLLLLVLYHIQISMIVKVLTNLFNRNAEADVAVL